MFLHLHEKRKLLNVAICCCYEPLNVIKFYVPRLLSKNHRLLLKALHAVIIIEYSSKNQVGMIFLWKFFIRLWLDKFHICRIERIPKIPSIQNIQNVHFEAKNVDFEVKKVRFWPSNKRLQPLNVCLVSLSYFREILWNNFDAINFVFSENVE